MDETPNIYSNLRYQTQFSSNKISKIKGYFIAKTQEREAVSKRLSKYITTFDHFDKTLTVLFATSEGISVTSFSSIIGIPVGIAIAILVLRFP